VKITPGFQSYAEGSVLIELGRTRVVCSVSVEDKVPPHLRKSGTGWVTAEYAMLPRATLTRSDRDSSKGKVSGRSQEIQRLIGRSLRAVTDMTSLGERTFAIDCDVLQAGDYRRICRAIPGDGQAGKHGRHFLNTFKLSGGGNERGNCAQHQAA
jgi:ribonuclease PH